MIFCPECGAKLVSQKFCHECGANIGKYLKQQTTTNDSSNTFDFNTLNNEVEKQLIEY